jgi:hypothetical protein
MDKIEQYIKDEIVGCFNFFNSEKIVNLDESSKGFGLVLDSNKNLSACSMAGCGYAMCAYIIGIEHQLITRDVIEIRIEKMLESYLNIKTFNGFFPHFVDYHTAVRYNNCEFSTIDTAILLNGVYVAMEYFKDNKKINDLSRKLINQVDYQSFITTKNQKHVFRMAYNDKKDGAYVDSNTRDGYISYWDMSAEQLMMYIQYAALDSTSSEDAKLLYNGFERHLGSYKGENFVFEPGGTLFTYQFSHAFCNFQKIVDEHGFNWHVNSCHASIANYQSCKDSELKTFMNNKLWGLSAGSVHGGYEVAGALPNIHNKINSEGFMTIYSVLAAINFVPEIVIDTLVELNECHQKAIGEFGFYESLKYFDQEVWYSDTYLAIDKGITIIMLDNYLNGSVHKFYMNNPLIKNGLNKLGFRGIND